MNWTELLKEEMGITYASTEKLFALVKDEDLSWKPESGQNWMTFGQLLQHTADACGKMAKGFITGDWGLPEGMSFEDLPPEQMMPPAEEMPTVSSVEEARRLLKEDRDIAFAMMDQVNEEDLINTMISAPWEAPDHRRSLGFHLLTCVQHLTQHKSQLFYYLKLKGEAVNTYHLWNA
jgi:hypothetical protein